MLKTIKNFYNWLYNYYIKEEWNIYKKIGKIIIYPFWLIRSILIYIISPLYFIYYILYKKYGLL